MPIKRLTFGRTACNLCAPSRPAEGQARRRRGNLMERTSRFAPSRCQVLRGPVRPPEDGCGTCLAAGSHVPRRGRFPACPARLDGPSRHHRNAPMSLVESPVRQATHAPRFQPTGYAQESPARAATTARSEEHTSELQSLMRISYAVFCLKKKKQPTTTTRTTGKQKTNITQT